MKAGLFASVLGVVLISASSQATAKAASGGADLILTDARVYTLRWGEPALYGKPAPDAPTTAPKPAWDAPALEDGSDAPAHSVASRHWRLP